MSRQKSRSTVAENPLQRSRSICKGQLNKSLIQLSEITGPSVEELEERSAVGREMWDRYERIQLMIEEKYAENIEEEVNYRYDMQELYGKFKLSIHKLREQFGAVVPQGIDVCIKRNQDRSMCNNSTSSIHFAPLCDEESFKNFVNRLETFLLLKAVKDKEMKIYILLHALTPILHQKLYCLCAPGDPKTMSYLELVKLLEEHLDPQPSLWARQHKFVSRIQESNEKVTEFATELQKLSVNCAFNCKCCESVSELFLNLQFVRGLQDTEIRTKLLQETAPRTFRDVVHTASTIELAKSEGVLVQHREPINSVGPPKTITHARKNWGKLKNSLKESSEVQSKGQPQRSCYRCGNPGHGCIFKNEKCRYCGKIGHIARVCREKARQEGIYDLEEESDANSEPD